MKIKDTTISSYDRPLTEVENNYVTQRLSEENICFQTSFVNFNIGINAILMLSQLCYWTPRAYQNNGWIFKNMNEWENELGITYKQQCTARKKLRSIGLVTEKVAGRSGIRCVYFKVNESKLKELMIKHSNDCDFNIFDTLFNMCSSRNTLMSCMLSKRVVAFKKVFVDIGLSVNSALMLSQLYYWTPKARKNQGWVFKTMDEWKTETGLKRIQQVNARNQLKQFGILEEERRGNPARLYYRINTSKLRRLIAALMTDDDYSYDPYGERKAIKVRYKSKINVDKSVDNSVDNFLGDFSNTPFEHSKCPKCAYAYKPNVHTYKETTTEITKDIDNIDNNRDLNNITISKLSKFSKLSDNFSEEGSYSFGDDDKNRVDRDSKVGLAEGSFVIGDDFDQQNVISETETSSGDDGLEVRYDVYKQYCDQRNNITNLPYYIFFNEDSALWARYEALMRDEFASNAFLLRMIGSAKDDFDNRNRSFSSSGGMTYSQFYSRGYYEIKKSIKNTTNTPLKTTESFTESKKDTLVYETTLKSKNALRKSYIKKFDKNSKFYTLQDISNPYCDDSPGKILIDYDDNINPDLCEELNNLAGRNFSYHATNKLIKNLAASQIVKNDVKQFSSLDALKKYVVKVLSFEQRKEEDLNNNVNWIPTNLLTFWETSAVI